MDAVEQVEDEEALWDVMDLVAEQVVEWVAEQVLVNLE